MNILIIGGGGREHCLAWKISKSAMADKIFVAPGNIGMAGVAECVDIGVNDFKSLADFAVNQNIGLTVVGPEAPLVGGIADYFRERGLDVFGPGKQGAKIEGSKVFTKNLARKYKIPAARGHVFSEQDYKLAQKYIQDIDRYPLVLKADGLAAGKGVIIANDRSQALAGLGDLFLDKKFGDAARKIIIEEFLEGYELSLLCLYDGHRLLPLDTAQDYKRIFDQDRGKNTGGMGSYSPVPWADKPLMDKIVNQIIEPTCRGLESEQIDYRGILYAGLMISDGQPYLLEYNCRFGDPETQAVLPRMEDDLLPYLIDCARGQLKAGEAAWSRKKCVCVILASRGYPETSSKGDIITGLKDAAGDESILIFHAGTGDKDGHVATNGGRVSGSSKYG
ncbi:MAG: phosphoribosylamine--glycine ligase [Actinomycetota bacterium]|nr:phosphoribosylamine--glycine ligase [Actinomycetota bacterium]